MTTQIQVKVRNEETPPTKTSMNKEMVMLTSASRTLVKEVKRKKLR
jgi:hypothetical protein